MRKHRSFKHNQNGVKEEPKNRAGKYMAIFIAAVMVLSIGGVFLSNPDSEADYSYGGYNFKSSNNFWTTRIDGKETKFYLLPDQVANLDVSKQAIALIKNSYGLVITSNPAQDPESRLQAIDIFKFDFANAYLETYSSKQIGFGFTQKVNNSKFKVLTCDNSTYLFPVLNIEFSNETNVKVIRGCIVISAIDEYGLLALLDNLRFNLLGVFE